MQNKIKRATANVAKAQQLTQQCKAAMLTGGSYVLYKLAIAEEDAAQAKLNTLLALEQA